MSVTRSLPAVAIAIVLSVSTSWTAAAQESTPDPAAQAAEQARQQAEAAAATGPRFEPVPNGYAGCVNEPPDADRVQPTVPPGYSPQPGMNGGPGWLVSAPRGQAHPGDPAEISLRDKFATTNRMVYADVYRPDGTFARAGTVLFGSRVASLTYPSTFSSGSPLVTGTYTVVWRDTITDQFIACDGFTVTP